MLRISEMYVHFYLSETVSDRTEKIRSGLILLALYRKSLPLPPLLASWSHVSTP